jgi:hypothetical protein
MSSNRKNPPIISPDDSAVPFENAVEAWFWFILAQQAKNDGAQIRAGQSPIKRPCEPIDILKILDNLYRQRMLLREHLLILRHYGRRQMLPDPKRIKEKRACIIWKEAIDRIEPVLIRKGIVSQKKLTTTRPNKFWSIGAVVHENKSVESI